MEKIVFNNDNLVNDKIDEKTTKVRAILINEKNEILLTNYGGVYLLPGGTLEIGESVEETLIRELKEEIGIELALECLSPYLLVEQLIKNYPKRNNKGYVNRLMITYYYVVHINQLEIGNKTSLTDNEIKDGFCTQIVSIEEIQALLMKNTTNNPRDKYFSREILAIAEKLQQDFNNDTILKKLSYSEKVN